MQELEKILKEIKGLHGEVGSECTIEDRHAKRAWEHCLKRVEDIICKHMNDGWIPVEKELPPNAKRFNPLPSCEGRHFEFLKIRSTWLLQSTSLLRGKTQRFRKIVRRIASIHFPLAREDEQLVS